MKYLLLLLLISCAENQTWTEEKQLCERDRKEQIPNKCYEGEVEIPCSRMPIKDDSEEPECTNLIPYDRVSVMPFRVFR